jgi:hypothetical protein
MVQGPPPPPSRERVLRPPRIRHSASAWTARRCTDPLRSGERGRSGELRDETGAAKTAELVLRSGAVTSGVMADAARRWKFSVVLAAAAVALAVPVHADPSTPYTPRPNADNLFLMALTHFNVRVTADRIPKFIAVGKQVCTYIGQGHTPTEAIQEVYTHNEDMNEDAAGALVGSAIEAYCPQVPE